MKRHLTKLWNDWRHQMLGHFPNPWESDADIVQARDDQHAAAQDLTRSRLERDRRERIEVLRAQAEAQLRRRLNG